MENSRPTLIAIEEKQSLPILIVDKKGIIGTELADKLKKQFLIVLVSPEQVPVDGKEPEVDTNIIHIPYRRKVPIIPDNTYSHIFVFYNGEKEILDMLPAFMKKAKETGDKLFFLTSLTHSSETLFRRFAHPLYQSITVLLYGEVFDNKISSPNIVNLFIYQAVKYGRIVIPNEGLGKLYPIYLEDLLIVVIAAAFATELKRGNLFIFPRHPFTEISVARAFQKINPDLKIDFSRRKISELNFYIPSEGEYAFEKYDLEAGFRKMNLEKMVKNSELPKKHVTKPEKKRDLNYGLFFLILLISLILPFVVVLFSTLAGVGFLSMSVREAEKSKFQNASNYARVGEKALQGAYVVSKSYLPGDFVFVKSKEAFVDNLRSREQSADIASDLFSSLNTFSEIYNRKSNNSKKDFSRALTSVKNSLLRLDALRAQNKLSENLQTKIEENSYMITLLENSIDTLSETMGFEGRRKYLLLFQNNMELRPGGGFIGSYGVLDVDQGRMEKFEIHDVYDADGQLKTHIEPPPALRRYGGVSHWFLRDSNFDLDFTTNAAAASDILERSTGIHVDGVIAIDTNFIKNILVALKGVTVEDYHEEVSADNFYMLTQKHAEDNFFPGSTQKKDFLRALMSSMESSIFDKKSASYLALSKQIEKSIKEKHLLFAFAKPSVQEVFSVNNMSGTLWDVRKKEENSFYDYFGVVDANIGANKANYYLKRSIEQKAIISDKGDLNVTAEVTYSNASTKESVFGGDYKNYVRFILPTGSDLKTVSIDSKETPIIPAITNPSKFGAKNFKPPKQLEVASTQVDGHEVIAFFLIVPTDTQKKVTIDYVVPRSVNTSQAAFSYNLRIFKQPGTDQDPYSLSIVYPSKFKPSDLDKDITDLGGKLVYDQPLTVDRDLRIQFSQK